MRLVQFELYKAIKSKLICFVFIFTCLLSSMLYLNYVHDTSSSIFEPALLNPTNAMSFFLSINLFLLYPIWSSLIGTFVGTYDEGNNNTIGNIIVNNGRYLPYVAKIFSLVIINLLMWVFLCLVGGIIALVRGGAIDVGVSKIFIQILISMAASFCVSLLAFVISTIFPNKMITNIFVILIICIPNMFSGNVNSFLGYINPIKYFDSFFANVFSNLSNVNNFRINSGTSTLWYLYFIYIIAILTVIFCVAKRKEYR